MKKLFRRIVNVTNIKRVMSVACVLSMLSAVGVTAQADSNNTALEDYKLKGLGRAQMDVDGSGEYGDNPEDFVYDSDDLRVFDNLVKDGKTSLANVINDYPTANVYALDTFANLTSAIDTLTEFPAGKYYYDSTTGTENAAELVRYIKENDTYYLCNQYGEKTSNEAQSVDENNLVEYTQMTQENLTAGTAGMVDKTFVLGNGSDNITYKNLKCDIYYLGSGRTFNISSIVGIENVGNYSKYDFIVNYLPITETLSMLGSSGSSLKSQQGNFYYNDCLLNYDNTSGELTITEGMFYFSIPNVSITHSFTIPIQVYFLDGIEIN